VNRRGFLGAVAGAFVFDPERLLWRRGAKMISIPEPRLTGIYWGDRIRGGRIYLELGDIREILKALQKELTEVKRGQLESPATGLWA
jgi:hypothetical protein